MTCIVDVNGDYSDLRDNLKLRTCSLDISEDTRVKTTQTTLCRNLGEKKGEGIFSKGGILAGDYGTYVTSLGIRVRGSGIETSTSLTCASIGVSCKL